MWRRSSAPVGAEHEGELRERVEQRGLGAAAHGERERSVGVRPAETGEQRRLKRMDLGEGRGAPGQIQGRSKGDAGGGVGRGARRAGRRGAARDTGEI